MYHVKPKAQDEYAVEPTRGKRGRPRGKGSRGGGRGRGTDKGKGKGNGKTADVALSESDEASSQEHAPEMAKVHE